MKFRFTLLVLISVSGLTVREILGGTMLYGDNPDCTRVREGRVKIKPTNQIVKGYAGMTYYDGVTEDEHAVILDTVDRFEDAYISDDSAPCQRQYNLCIAACLYRNTCLPLWVLEGELKEEELTSELYRNFRNFFAHNEYDQLACAMMYFNHEFGVCD